MDDSNSLEAAIRQRAQELYEQRGRLPGFEVEDWLRAEAEVKKERTQRLARSAYVSVKVAGVTYVAEYDPDHSEGYCPGEFRAGEPVRVRLEREKMFIMRPNGVELETRVVRQDAVT